MRRAVAVVGVVGALMIAAIGKAQVATSARLETPSVQRQMTVVEQGGVTFFPADEVMAALGGTVESAEDGFLVTLGGRTASLGPGSRFAVHQDQLIEMPAAPVFVENRVFVPWQFFQSFLRNADLGVGWDGESRTLRVGRLERQAIQVSASVVEVEGITKVVFELSARVESGVERRASSYLIRFRNHLQAPFQRQSYENRHLTGIEVRQNEIEIQLRSPDIAINSYTLQNPFRLVLEMKESGPEPVQPSIPLPRPRDLPGIRTIVIDPGHGGKEVGAMGSQGLLEKDLTLAISRRLREMLGGSLGVRVILTREDDSVVTLDQRTSIANQYGADLFLSIHLNAAPVRGAKGSETYFLSLEASDERARIAAERENQSRPGFGSDNDLDLILWDLAQQRYLRESSQFAEFVQEEMAEATGIEKRGVKQAPFRVLLGASMPAALVEVGFISNPDEEVRLQDAAYQTIIARALTRAIERYKQAYDTRAGVALSAMDEHDAASAAAPESAAGSSGSGRSRR